jgi:hypothetical protein
MKEGEENSRKAQGERRRGLESRSSEARPPYR